MYKYILSFLVLAMIQNTALAELFSVCSLDPSTHGSMLGAKCADECKERHKYYVDLGHTVTSWSCWQLGYTAAGSEKYCCGTNESKTLADACKCKDPNQKEVNGPALTHSLSSNSMSCSSNTYCYCDNGYYGTRQQVMSSTTNTCTKCPETEGFGYYAPGANDGIKRYKDATTQMTNNITNTNTTTIANCGFLPWPSDITHYIDEQGNRFKLTDRCTYKID